jgi:hypothetical protein
MYVSFGISNASAWISSLSYIQDSDGSWFPWVKLNIVYLYIHTLTHTHTYVIHTCTYTHTHTHIHVYTHTYIHPPLG